VRLSWRAWLHGIGRGALGPLLVLLFSAGFAGQVGSASAAAANGKLDQIDHFVVIYQENHSFDNLYGSWPGADGRSKAPKGKITQVDQSGQPYKCLLQNDPALASPPLANSCGGGVDADGKPFQSAFPNKPFPLDRASVRKEGGTLDLTHHFYQSRYQIDNGGMDHFAAGDAESAGLTMGYWNTRRLPVYKYLHHKGHPHYVIADRFFQAAFGGSFLNHQWLVAAHTPRWPHADNEGIIGNKGSDIHSVVDQNAMPRSYDPTDEEDPSLLYKSPLANATGILYDGRLTASCHPKQAGADTRPAPPPGTACGNWAINTLSPFYQPYRPGSAPSRLLPPQTHETIGNRLSAKGISWGWYSAGWSNADGDVGAPGWTNGTHPAPPTKESGAPCPDKSAEPDAVWPYCPDDAFKFHHQPFNFFASFAPGTAERNHLRDLVAFKQQVNRSGESCKLPQVSFTKLMANYNEHPGAIPYEGDKRATDLLKGVEQSACAKSTMVIFTYDEYGGAWDHVPPPGHGGTAGPHDKWGPGPRIPALVVAPHLRHGFSVDHAEHDTTSIAATLEHRFGLKPLSSRDAAVNDLSTVFSAHKPRP
jgi:acid phosphatase